MRLSTRLHGLIDYAVVGLFVTLYRSRALTRPVRGVLGAVGALHAGTAMMTDYEAGLAPRLSMRQHLAVDVLGALTLCGAGVLMRRQPAYARALLVGAGLSELAVVAMSTARPVSGPGQGGGAVGRLLSPSNAVETVEYRPLDTPKPVAPDVWIVDSALPGMVGRVLGARMTVLRLANGELLLHSPTRFSPRLKGALEMLGRIRHLVAPNPVHWMFLAEWQRACPDAVTWAAPGVRARGQVRRAGVELDHDIADGTQAAWGGAVEVVTVPGGLGFTETALFHHPSATLVLTDLVVNLEPRKVPLAMRPVVWLFGSTAPDGMPPPYLRALVRMRRTQAAEAVGRLLALKPMRVIFAHGRWFERDGTAALRRSLRWLGVAGATALPLGASPHR